MKQFILTALLLLGVASACYSGDGYLTTWKHHSIVIYESDESAAEHGHPSFMILKKRIYMFEIFDASMSAGIIGKYEVEGDTLRLYPKWECGGFENGDYEFRPCDTGGLHWKYLMKGDTIIADTADFHHKQRYIMINEL